MYRALCVALLTASMLHAAPPATTPLWVRPPSEPEATTKPGTQKYSVHENDPNSPRKSKLKSAKPDPSEIIRIDVDGDGDPDILETWWNGKRVRWLDENDDMKWTDRRGDMSGDSLQIDRDGDGYYDGPGDLNIKWVDDDGDGRADMQMFAANPALDAKTPHHGLAVWMIFIDVDHDGVLGYIDWTTFEFMAANWRVPPTTSPTN